MIRQRDLDNVSMGELCDYLGSLTPQDYMAALAQVRKRFKGLVLPVPVVSYGPSEGSANLRSEWNQLMAQDKCFSASYNQPAVALQLSGAQLFNVVGSGKTTLVRIVSGDTVGVNTTVALRVLVGQVPWDTAGAGALITSLTDFAAPASGFTTCTTGAVLVAGTAGVAADFVLGLATIQRLVPDGFLYMLREGQGLAVVSSAVNVQVLGSFQYAELTTGPEIGD